jgi:hypothetical protein
VIPLVDILEREREREREEKYELDWNDPPGCYFNSPGERNEAGSEGQGKEDQRNEADSSEINEVESVVILCGGVG